MERSSGVLLPMFSLPSKYGIGNMGKSAYDFIDFLSASGQKYWQLLPLGPASCGDSPYSAVSSFAGNPYYIDLDMLAAEGLLERSDFEHMDWGSEPSQVDYGKLYDARSKVLGIAFSRITPALREEMSRFFKENERWLSNYALYMALKEEFNMAEWTQWPDPAIRKHERAAVAAYGEKLKDRVDFYVFTQFLFYRQWTALRAYASEKGIKFIGDIPIYVPLDSADVWSEPEFFRLDSEYMPVEVAGVPPDAFTEEGQLWNNPLYDWDRMKADGYGWWIRRIEGAQRLYDVIRIDHFRGFESYWACPYGDTTAKNGRWRPGPGMGLVGVLTSWFYGLEFIAEDLGVITGGVRKLLEDSKLPGMKVLEFAFDHRGNSDYLPHNIGENSVCYVGTHDNDTVLGWMESSSAEDIGFAKRYMNISDEEGWCWGMIRTGMASPSKLFVVQMQDLLGLGGDCRTNTPGVPSGNWRWRMLPGAADAALAEKLLAYTQTFRRTALTVD